MSEKPMIPSETGRFIEDRLRDLPVPCGVEGSLGGGVESDLPPAVPRSR